MISPLLIDQLPVFFCRYSMCAQEYCNIVLCCLLTVDAEYSKLNIFVFTHILFLERKYCFSGMLKFTDFYLLFKPKVLYFKLYCM